MASDHPAVRAWRDSVADQQGGESEYALLRRFNTWLARFDPRGYHALESSVRALEARLLDMLAALKGWVVVCLDRSGVPNESARARYLRVFHGLATQVSHMMQGTDQLVIRAARFGLPHLTSADLSRQIKGVEPAVVVPKTRPYRNGVHPGIVLADLVANQVHRAVRDRGSVRPSEIERTLGAPVLLVALAPR